MRKSDIGVVIGFMCQVLGALQFPSKLFFQNARLHEELLKLVHDFLMRFDIFNALERQNTACGKKHALMRSVYGVLRVVLKSFSGRVQCFTSFLKEKRSVLIVLIQRKKPLSLG